MGDFLTYTDEKTKSQQVLSPEIIRVFTGLFLTVENLAEVYYNTVVIALEIYRH